jgi:O-antigen/teichoic acid export membrane protein
VTRLLSAVFTGVLTIFLIRELGPRDYGVFALAMGVGTITLLPSDFGISQAAARFVAERRHDRQQVHAVVSDALRLKLIVSGALCLVLAAVAGPVADAYGTPGLEWPIRILALAVFGQGLLGFYDQLFEAQRRMIVYLRIVGFESALEATASIGLVLAGLGVSGAMAGRAGAYLFAAGLGFVLLSRALGVTPSLRTRGGHVRRIASYGSALLIIDGAYVLFTQIDVLLIGAILGVTAVGRFQAPLRIVAFLGYAGTSAATGVAPRVARGVEGPNTRALEVALRRLMAFQGVLIAPLVVWAEPLTELAFGAGYGESADVLRGVTPYMFLLGISPLLARSISYLGEARRRIPIAIGAVAVNFAIDIALLSELGIIAAAIGTDVAYFFYAAAHLWICRRMLGIAVRPLGLTLFRTLLAAAVMSGVLVAFGTGTVAVPLLISGAVAGTAVYVGALLLLREVSPDELRRALRALRALFGQMRGGPARG